MEETEIRLDILRNSGQVSESVCRTVIRIFERLSEKWRLDLSGDSAGMFVTHLAIALQRIAEGECYQEENPQIWEELKKDENYSAAAEIFEDILPLIEKPVSEGERSFILLYLCMMKGKRE